MADITLPDKGELNWDVDLNKALTDINNDLNVTKAAVPTTPGAVGAEPAGLSNTTLNTLDGTFASREMAAAIATGAASTGLDTTLREYPKFRKYGSPWITFASQSAPSMLWLSAVDMRQFPGALDNIYVFYSTDHGTSRTTAGIYLITMSDPYGANKVDRGLVYNIPVGPTGQPETPTVWLDFAVNTLITNVAVLSASTDLITKSSHGLVNGDRVYFSSIAPFTSGPVYPLAGADYYVVNATTNNFQISNTPGGTVVDITVDSNAAVYKKASAPLIRMLYQVNTGITPAGESQQAQETRMLTSPTGLAGTWTDIGSCMYPAPTIPGAPHNGYARIWRLGNQMYAHTLSGAGAFMLWESSQGGLPGTWVNDGRRIVNNADQITHLPEFTFQSIIKLNQAVVFDYRGRLWWVGSIAPPAGGVEGGEDPANIFHIYAAPLTSDMRRFAAAPVKVTPGKAPWETDSQGRTGGLGLAFLYDNDVFIPYRTDIKTSDWGLYILDQGY